MSCRFHTGRKRFIASGLLRKRGYALAFILLLFIPVTKAQIKDIGIPFINNYPKTVYKASNQNWSIAQGRNGFIYFGNNDGLLEFDGQHWELYPLPGRTIIRSLLAEGDTIYAGSFEELGYFTPGNDGRMHFQSLTHLIPEYFRSFDEIWEIHKTNQGIVFQSFRYLFIYRSNQIRVIEPFSSFSQSFLTDGKVYVVDRKKGLLRMDGRGLETVLDDPLLLRTEVRFLMHTGNGELLMGTSTEGIFTIKNGKLQSWAAPVNELLKRYELFTGISLHDNYLAFGTVQNGVYISDGAGRLLQHLNRSKGMQNNTVLSLFGDRHHNLWMGLDNGIDYAEINSPLSVFDFNYQLEATYASVVHNGKLYAGTNQGLFYINMPDLGNSASGEETFRIIPGTEGQVWCLSVFEGQLLCGHNTGCFRIDGSTAEKISDIPGYWTFIRHGRSGDTLFAGTYNGLSVLTAKNGKWAFSHEVSGFRESSRTILQDEDGSVWISHGYRGVFNIRLSRDLTKAETVTLYKSSKGLPETLPYNIHKFGQEFNISAADGLYRYDRRTDMFYKNPKYTELFRGLPYVDRITADSAGNFWFFTNTFMGVIRQNEKGDPVTELAPFFRVNSRLIPSFEHIYIQNERNVYIGSQEGLIHFTPRFGDNEKRGSDPVFIRSVRFIGNDTTRVYANDTSSSETTGHLRLSFRYNSVNFTFASPSFEFPEGTVYSYRLRGFDQHWSGWSPQSFKEYTNLKEGEYVFELRARNAFLSESEPITFSFTIKPPLHRSLAARIFYSLILALIFAGNVVFVRRRIEKARKAEIIRSERELEEQAQVFREQALINEREIIKLKNEALENEMKHKTQELASTTLNLVHKNRMLTNLKQQLGAMLQPQPGQDQKVVLSQIIRRINKEIKNEQHLEAFNTYFDDVHRDFIVRLREAHPGLSPRELRLCTYLRMNLSSKEIAPLMNISVRGLEISRYRLRRKLNLGHEVNLTEFIMSF